MGAPQGIDTSRKVAELLQQTISELDKNNLVQEINLESTLPPDDPKSNSPNAHVFITIQISVAYITTRVSDFVECGVKPLQCERKRVIVDFSSPNVAKEMHVGHLRSTIIGDTICRMLEFAGHTVERVNHVGDWGTQFGMLIAHLKNVFPDFSTTPPPISDLQQFYREAKKVFDEDENFKSNAHAEVVRLQSGDHQSRRAWQQICDVSRREFEKVYSRLGVQLTEVGESFYNEHIPAVLDHLEELGISKVQDGATVIFPSGTKLPHPLIVKKSDGGFGYDSTDMAAIWYRVLEKRADWVIYVTDAGQAAHFELIFAAAKDAGWVSEQRIDHCPFGLVCGSDGKKFKTRSGEVTRLVDLLDEAVSRMEAELRKRWEEELQGEEEILDETKLIDTARKMGYAAVKYADLKSNRTSNYVFSFDRMLDPRGNTSVYLHYAGVRLASVFRKAVAKGINLEEIIITGSDITLSTPSEIALAFQLARFHEVVERALEELLPSLICDYVYAISSNLARFYFECKILNSPEQNSRLQLVRATQLVIQKCFDILGIGYIDKC